MDRRPRDVDRWDHRGRFQSFDWRVKKADGSLKYPLVAGTAESYHGGDFMNHPIFGVDACNLVFILLARVKTLRDMGGCIAPFNAFQFIQGLETLSLRCKAHCENANQLARMAQRPRGSEEGSGLSISCRRTRRTNSRRSISGRAASVPYSRVRARGRHRGPGPRARQEVHHGAQDVRSFRGRRGCPYVGHPPASTTHQQLPTEQQIAAGVGRRACATSPWATRTSRTSRPTSTRRSPLRAPETRRVATEGT